MRSNFQMTHLSPYKSDAFSQSKLQNDSIMQSSIQSLVRTNRELQDRLNEQKSKNFDLLQLKRRLEEEINRLEFELDRMKSYDNLNSREALIKSEMVHKENQKIRQQTQHYIIEIQRLRVQVRQLMSECQLLSKQKQDLQSQNHTLLQTIQRKEKQQNQRPIKQIQTFHSPQKILSPKSGHLSTIPSQQYLSPTMKEIPENFYQESNPSIERYFKNPTILKSLEKIENQENQSIAIEKSQKKEVKGQVNHLRDDLVEQILNKYYRKSLEIAKEEKSNSLKLFIHEIDKNLEVLHRMAINYLQARHTMMSTCPSPRNNFKQYTNSNDKWVLTVYEEVKKKTKEENTPAAIFLGLFRLLTLLDKVEDIDEELLNQIKHTALKLIHKVHQKKS